MPSSKIRFRFLDLLTALNVTFLLVSDFTGARIIGIYGVGVSVTVLYFPLTYSLATSSPRFTAIALYGASRKPNRSIIMISIPTSIPF
jgi:hypothetical protein